MLIETKIKLGIGKEIHFGQVKFERHIKYLSKQLDMGLWSSGKSLV